MTKPTCKCWKYDEYTQRYRFIAGPIAMGYYRWDDMFNNYCPHCGAKAEEV